MASEQSVIAVIRAARPTFRTRYDKVAFAVNAAFVAAGCALHATGPSALRDDALTSSSPDEVGFGGWNGDDDTYAFVYSWNKVSGRVLVKCIALNDKLFLDVLKEGGSEPMHLELDVGDYVEDNGGTNYGSQFKNLGKLVTTVNKEILDKLGFASASVSLHQPSRSSEGTSSEANPRVGVDDHEDPYNVPHPGFLVPPVPGYGGSDLFPGPGAGMYPSRGDTGGSSLVGPNDPIFFGGRGTGRLGFPGNAQGVPPGARFDPYGPPDVPGFEPGRFVRNPQRPRGGPHPDLQHFHDGSDFI